MLVEASLGKLDSFPRAQIDWLDLNWSECARRAMRKQTRGGRQVRILLKLGAILKHRDVLWRSSDATEVIAINVLESEVLVALIRGQTEIATLAFELGNLHVPIELAGQELITPCDGPSEAIFQKLGVPYQQQIRRFEPTLRGDPQIVLAKNFELIREQ